MFVLYCLLPIELLIELPIELPIGVLRGAPRGAPRAAPRGVPRGVRTLCSDSKGKAPCYSCPCWSEHSAGNHMKIIGNHRKSYEIPMAIMKTTGKS